MDTPDRPGHLLYQVQGNFVVACLLGALAGHPGGPFACAAQGRSQSPAVQSRPAARLALAHLAAMARLHLHDLPRSPSPPAPQAGRGRRVAGGAAPPRAGQCRRLPWQHHGTHGQLAARLGPSQVPAQPAGAESAGGRALLAPSLVPGMPCTCSSAQLRALHGCCMIAHAAPLPMLCLPHPDLLV